VVFHTDDTKSNTHPTDRLKFGGLAQNEVHTAAADVIPNTSALMKIG